MEAPQPASSRLSLKAIAQALFFFFSALGVLALTIKGKTEDKEKKKKKKQTLGKDKGLIDLMRLLTMMVPGQK